MNILKQPKTVPTSAVRKRNGLTLSKIFVTVVFYLSLVILLYSSYLRAIEAESRLFAGASIFTLCLSGIIATFFNKDCRKLLLDKFVIIYGIFLFIYILMGWRVFGNDTQAILADFGGFRGFYWGLFLFYLILKSYQPKIQLFTFIFIPNLLVLYGQILELDRTGTTLSRIETRLGGGLEPVNFFLLIPMGIAICVLSRSGWQWAIAIWAMPIMFFYTSGFLAARRYIFICIPVLMLLCTLILTYKLSNGVLETRSYFIKHKRIRNIIVWISLTLASFIIIEFFLNVIDLVADTFGDWLVFDRFSQISSGDRSTELRFVEALQAIQSHEDLEFIFGRGLGATFFSLPQSTYTNAANWCHISLFNYWLKGGLLLFSFFIYIFYIHFPRLFLKALRKPYAFDPRKRTALLTVLPGVFAWALLSLTEGRITHLYTVPLGFAFAAYYHFKKHGLRL